ncbi:DUF2894 domain-containing protein [Luteimonas sp. 3794]|uniref:DUF2894 domain-containing protein n=1 Tax=Luteimonas sp. 3794 TaxID=2817730 RepID=UPI00285D6761|nr:DUF2894 domain-containing protein [Luteimonas sp. 3794]MDR6992224.1 hypothetical protein [Luteimonas sp. 3794]
MAADRLDIDAVLDGWRATGADRLDPLRFHRIAALHRRAAVLDGAARHALDAKLAALVDAYTRDVEGWPREAIDGTPVRGVLGTLVDGMTARTQHASANAAYPELPAVDEFRTLWSTLRTGSQVRKSLAEVPTGAGPLNSAALAHRSLTLMGGLSPEYLRQFLAYVDTLSWLETLQDAGVLTGKDTAPPVGAKPRKPRARKRG